MRGLRRAALGLVGALACVAAVPGAGVAAQAQEAPGLEVWLSEVDGALVAVARAAGAGDVERARSLALRAYLDRFERIEGFYGPGGPYAEGALSALVSGAEARFHELLRGDAGSIPAVVAALREDVARIRAAARRAGVPLEPAAGDAIGGPAAVAAPAAPARTPEIRAIVGELRAAERAYLEGDAARAQAGVDHAYLEGIELLEARLPSALAGRIERLIHLSIRPQLQQGAPADQVGAAFASLYGELARADAALGSARSFWFGAINSFVIIVREGLEAVLLIAALIAYLGATGASRKYHVRLYAGAALGVVASVGTWAVARTLIPIGGANRELIEGVTALVAVGVLVYVAHWLFHKTYVHDWKRYLRDQLGRAVTTGSAFAMASLAFAAVYREGFETILFYQTLRFDVGSGAVLAGFAPGVLLILLIGVTIIRFGLRLPLRQLFGATNALLLYLALVFLGKGVYNLQEAGVFAPHPLAWAPDHEALRLLLGFYPIAETLVAQAAFVVLVVTTYLLYRRSLASKAPASPPHPAPTTAAAQ